MKRLNVLVLMVVGFMVLGVSLVYATEDIADTQTSQVTLTIEETSQLGISNPNVTGSLNRDGNSETSYDAGYYVFTGNPLLNVDANKKWKLTAHVGDWSLPTGYPSGGNKKTVSSDSDILLYATGGAHITGFNTQTPAPTTGTNVNGVLLSSTAQTMASHTSGVSDDEYTCTYSVFLDWTNEIPGKYSIQVTYTLVTEA